jgi:DNA-binding beta-propeller fold protein YncE
VVGREDVEGKREKHQLLNRNSERIPRSLLQGSSIFRNPLWRLEALSTNCSYFEPFGLRTVRVFVMVLFVFWWLIPATSFCGQKGRVRHLYSITGSERTGHLGLLGGVFFDENKDRLYVADASGNRILAFDSDFKFLSEFDGGGRLNSPTSLVRDSLGRFFVAQPTAGQVLLVDIAQKRIEPLDFSGVPQGNAVHPGNMAMDSQDRLYLVDKANQRILVFGPALEFQRQIVVSGGRGLNDVVVDAGGRLYALNRLDGSVHVFDGKGELLLKFGKRGSAQGQFRFPVSLAEDGKGRIFVVDQHKSNISVFSKDGKFLYDFSQLGWREGRLHYPSQIAVNNAGRIFVVDRQNARVSVFEPR